jgi:acetyltransferase-like isoleucine patch superfamily enzyme
MNSRVLAGSLFAYTFNAWIGKWPSRTLRRSYLRMWLGRFGKGSNVQMGCTFLNGRKVFLQERCVLNFGTLLDGRVHTITIGSDCSIGPRASILTLGHDPQARNFANKGGDVVMGNRVWIGYGALVLPGVTIGEGAVIGAGSVVTKDVEPFSICAGIPARKVGERNPEIDYNLRYDPWLV